MSSFVPKDHLAIQFYIPPVGAWIWGVSRWDTGETWGGSSSAADWTDLKCESFAVDIENANQVDAGIFVNPVPGRAVISMQSAQYDPFQHGTIHVGTPVRVRMTSMSEWTPAQDYWNLFTGIVDSFEVTYDAWGNNQIRIVAVNAMQEFLNTPVTSFTTSGLSYGADIMNQLGNTYYPGYWAGSDSNRSVIVAAKTWTNTTVGQIASEIIKADLGLLWTDASGNGNYITQVSFDNYAAGTPKWYFSSVHSTSTTHICMSDLKFSANSKGVPNVINITDVISTTYQLKNQDAIDLYGPIALNEDILISGIDKANVWFSLLNPSTNNRRVESITFPAVTRAGAPVLFNQNVYYGDYFYNPVNVVYNKGGLNLNENYVVVGVSQSLDPYNWSTTVELWRGI